MSLQKNLNQKKPQTTVTPPLEIYECIKNYAVNKYNLEGREIVRPFYPGGDFENFEYPTGCVVIDNPPFSILSKIKDFYVKNNIDFFLFAPTLTLFASGRAGNVNYIVSSNQIVYHNGAKVNTSFITNLGKNFIETDPELHKKIKKIQKQKTTKRVKYKLPNNVITAALLAKCNTQGTKIELKREECYFIRQLDQQKEDKKMIFGGGFIVKNEIFTGDENNSDFDFKWELSEREKEIVKNLGQ